MKNSILFALMIATLYSCEKTVDLEYKSNESTLIIEGNITNQAGPYFVKITRSVRLTDLANYPTVDNAVVTIKDDAGHTEALVPQGNGSCRSDQLTGTAGRTYTLTVQAAGQMYTAQSTMPRRVPLQSVSVEEVTAMGETEYNIIPLYTDPPEKGDSYHFLVAINTQAVHQHFLLDDAVKNGVANTFRLEINTNDHELKKGDTVSVTMQCVDPKAALFYKTLMLMGDSGPGGSTTPNNPPNNISNGALGLFSAHTVETKTVVIP